CLTSFYIRSCFFFFQAEDGIRDFHVTGVQTCALPICDLVWRFLLPSLPRQRKSHISQGLVPNSQTVFPEVLPRSSRFYAVPFHGLFSLRDAPVLPKLPFVQWF